MINWKQFLQAILMFVIYLLVISFYLAPYLYFFFSKSVLGQQQETAKLMDWIRWQSTPLKDLLRLAREHTLYPFNYPYQYFQKFVLAIAYYPFLIVIASLLFFQRFKFKDKKWFFFFLFVLLCFVFFNAKSEISQRLSLFIFTLPIFSILRSADKFIIFFPFLISFLMVYFFKIFIDKIKKTRTRNIFYIIFIFLIFSYPLPFLLGGFQKKLPKWPNDQWSNIVKMPKAYKEVAEYINSDQDYFKVLSMPFGGQVGIGWILYPKWKYIGVDFTTLYFDKPVLNSVYIETHYPFSDYFQENTDDFRKYFIKTLQTRGIRYIIFNNDVYNDYHEPLKSLIKNDFKEDIFFVKSFGNLDLYKLDPSQEWSLFFSVNKDYKYRAFTENNCIEKRDCLQKTFLERVESFIRDQDLSLEGQSRIAFKRLSPVKYKIQIQNASEPFWLVFSDTFHKDWKIYENQESSNNFLFDLKYSLKKPLEFEHKIINDYANAWYIEPQKLDNQKDFDLIVYFLPQNIFYLGVGISGMTILLYVGYLILSRSRHKK